MVVYFSKSLRGGEQSKAKAVISKIVPRGGMVF